MSEVRIAYTARADATPGSERETLASIYAFVLRTHQERLEAAPTRHPEGAEVRPDGGAYQR